MITTRAFIICISAAKLVSGSCDEEFVPEDRELRLWEDICRYVVRLYYYVGAETDDVLRDDWVERYDNSVTQDELTELPTDPSGRHFYNTKTKTVQRERPLLAPKHALSIFRKEDITGKKGREGRPRAECRGWAWNYQYKNEHNVTEDYAMIMFRGTVPGIADGLADLKGFAETKIKIEGDFSTTGFFQDKNPLGCHGGINQRFNEMWPDIIDTLRKILARKEDTKVIPVILLSGHSLGGALAMIAALKLCAMQRDFRRNSRNPSDMNAIFFKAQIKVVTYGSPKIFNAYTAEYYDTMLNMKKHTNMIAMNGDPVSETDAFGWFKSDAGYYHAGKMFNIKSYLFKSWDDPLAIAKHSSLLYLRSLEMANNPEYAAELATMQTSRGRGFSALTAEFCINPNSSQKDIPIGRGWNELVENCLTCEANKKKDIACWACHTCVSKRCGKCKGYGVPYSVRKKGYKVHIERDLCKGCGGTGISNGTRRLLSEDTDLRQALAKFRARRLSSSSATKP